MTEQAAGHQTEIEVAFEDMTVLSEDGTDIFVLKWDADGGPPPFYVDVSGRRFGFTADTFLLNGHGASLPSFIREEEEAGRIPLLVERDDRYYVYLHDPTAEDEVDE